GLVGDEEPVGNGIARGIKEARAAMDVPPALEGDALVIGADEEIALEFLAGNLRDVLRPRDVRLAGMPEFELRPLFLAIGAVDQEHAETSVRHGSRRRLVDEPAGTEALEREGRVDRVRLVARDGVGEDMAGARRRLEAARAPAAVDV